MRNCRDEIKKRPLERRFCWFYQDDESKELVMICSNPASCSMWMFLIVSRQDEGSWWENSEVEGGQQKCVRVFQSTWSYWPGRTSTWQLAARGHGRVFFCVYVQMCAAGFLPVICTHRRTFNLPALLSWAWNQMQAELFWRYVNVFIYLKSDGTRWVWPECDSIWRVELLIQNNKLWVCSRVFPKLKWKLFTFCLHSLHDGTGTRSLCRRLWFE